MCFVCGGEIDWQRDPGNTNLDQAPFNKVPWDEIRFGVRGKRKSFTFHSGNCQSKYWADRKSLHEQLLAEDKSDKKPRTN